MKINTKNLPPEFEYLPFILWRAEEGEDGRIEKKPISPKTGQYCDVTDEAHHKTLKECEYIHTQGKYKTSGIGVVFTGEGYYGIDLDHVYEEGGNKEIAEDFLRNFSTYSEYSPSKTGLHIYGFGYLPDGPRRKENIEFYDSGRFFTVTGDRINGAKMLLEPDALKRMYKKYMQSEKPKKPRKETHQGKPLKKEDLIYHISESSSGDSFQRLMSGDFGAYASQSEADAALCMILASWTNKDARKIDEIFRTSQLMRDKWDQKHSKDGRTYGQMTIDSAILKCNWVYTDAIPRVIKEEDLEEKLPEEYPVLPVEIKGLAGKLSQFMDLRAIHPQPILHVGAALAMLGTLLGRKIKSASGLRTNIYVLSLAPTGAGKEHARSVIDRVLTNSGAVHYLGGDDIASDTGLLAALAEQPSLLLMLDEFGYMAQQFLNPRAAGFKASIVEVLLSIYGKSSTAYHGKMYANRKERPQVRIEQPSLCLYCTSTPESFWPAIRQNSVHDGFLNRFLVFNSPDPFPPFVEREDIAVPEFMVEPVRTLARIPEPMINRMIEGYAMNPVPNPKVITDSPSAKECFLSYRDLYLKHAKEDAVMASLWKRAEEQAIKISLILAGSERQDSISGEQAETGCKVAKFCIENMLTQISDHLAENQHEANLKKVLRIIRKSGRQGLDGTSLTRKTQYLTSKQRIEVVEVMVETGQISVNPVKSANGKIKNTYFAV
jgi:predicted nucleic acid-binding Zn ribbon protein